MITLNGLKNCDTCRKALKWLAANDIAHEFRDLRQEPPTTVEVERWLLELPVEKLVNRRSTTWRQLDDASREAVMKDDTAAVLCANPSLIKRPLFEAEGLCLVGFEPAVQTTLRKAG